MQVGTRAQNVFARRPIRPSRSSWPLGRIGPRSATTPLARSCADWSWARACVRLPTQEMSFRDQVLSTSARPQAPMVRGRGIRPTKTGCQRARSARPIVAVVFRRERLRSWPTEGQKRQRRCEASGRQNICRVAWQGVEGQPGHFLSVVRGSCKASSSPEMSMPQPPSPHRRYSL